MNVSLIEKSITSPTAWFAELEIAMGRGDIQRAAVAQRELERLGVKVKFSPAPQRNPVLRLVK